MPHDRLGKEGPQGTTGIYIVGYKGAPTLANGRVTIGPAPTLIVGENPRRRTILVRNVGANDIFLGGEFVNVTQGMPLPANTEKVFELSAELWGITAATNEEVRYLTEQDI
jgi:hypothetical protein